MAGAAEYPTVYLGLGSNLGRPEAQIRSACEAIDALEGVHLLAVSGLYGNPPMGPADQPDYVNAVAAVEARLQPEDLLKRLQAVELEHGRIRNGVRWGPRTLDIDILLYADRVIQTPDLTVPHPGVTERAFVLVPLFEIAPDIEIPGHGPLGRLVSACSRDGLRRMN